MRKQRRPKARQTQNHKASAPNTEPAKIPRSPQITPRQLEPPKCVQAQLSEHPQKKSLAQGFLRWSGIVAAWTTASVTLLGALFFLPRVSVETSGPYDPSNPTPISFTITNSNIIPLRNFQAGVGLCFLKFMPLSGDEPKCDDESTTRFINPYWFANWLNPDEKFQIFLEDLMKEASPIGKPKDLNGNITIYVEYSSWYAFWRDSKEFRFITRKLSDGKTYWIPIPLHRGEKSWAAH